MKQKIIIHAGTPKTGTTAIQLFLSAHRSEFLEYGYWYPHLGVPEEHPFAQHYLAQHFTSNDRSEKTESAWLTFLEESRNYPNKAILISSENFWWLGDNNAIEALLSALIEHFDPTILFYLRRQDCYIQALYCTLILYFNERRCFQEFNHSIDKNYYSILNRWSEVFGKDKIKVRVYEREQLVNHDIVSDFLNATQIECNLPSENTTYKNINTNIPRHAIDLFFHLNQNSDKQQMISSLRSLVHQLYQGRSFPYSYLGVKETKAMLEFYAESNRKVAVEYLGRNDGKLFQEIVEEANVSTRADPLPLETCINQCFSDLCEWANR